MSDFMSITREGLNRIVVNDDDRSRLCFRKRTFILFFLNDCKTKEMIDREMRNTCYFNNFVIETFNERDPEDMFERIEWLFKTKFPQIRAAIKSSSSSFALKKASGTNKS